jgi:hypothetical protein
METEQFTFEWSVGYWWNKREKKTLKSKWEWKQTLPEPLGHSKSVLSEMLTAVSAYIKISDQIPINKWMMLLKLLEKQELSSPKSEHGKK